MQLDEQGKFQQSANQEDMYSYPLPVRIKHPSWSTRKRTYQQILYLLSNISNPNEQMLISGNCYKVQSLLPHFQHLIQQKHAAVLLKGLECVQQILKLDKKAANKHCIKILVDKGVQYFPLLSQQRKSILEKFLDILQMSKIDANFLKNKLNLPHEKSVMYVIEVIGVLNVTPLKSVLVNLSKKHQKKCVRQLAAQISEQLSEQNQEEPKNQDVQLIKYKGNKSQVSSAKNPSKPVPNCKITIQKLPHYEQLNSKQQQQFSSQILQKINTITEEYTVSQLPNFSHFLRLMIDDNNHIINTNAIRCLIAIFTKQRQDGLSNGSLIPVSFPLLFIFNKFKSHKTHPINSLLLALSEAVLRSSANRVNDLILAINQGLGSTGSKANVKFGCALAFFRIIALLHQNQDLYACTTNQNIQNENQDLTKKFSRFKEISIGKNLQKTIEKIILTLQKDKKYDIEMYLIKYAIGLYGNSMVKSTSGNELLTKNNKSIGIKNLSEQKIKSTTKVAQDDKGKKRSINQTVNQKKPQSIQSRQKQVWKGQPLSTTLKSTKSSQKFQQINLEQSLSAITQQLNRYHQNQQKQTLKRISCLLQKSSEQFYQCVRQKRYEMFYLCQLLQNFIHNYQPNDTTIQNVSQFLISILKIISFLKPMNSSNQKSSTFTEQFRQISLHNVSQLLLVSLCKLVISEQIQQILENLTQNYDFEVVLGSLSILLLSSGNNKIKKKNKKFLVVWLESNTPAIYVDSEYYVLLQKIKQKQPKARQKQVVGQQLTQQHQNGVHLLYNLQKSPKGKSPHTFQRLYSSRKQNPVTQQLQNINLSKIYRNGVESNYQEQDLQKSSFDQNIQQHLKQIASQRSQDEYYFEKRSEDNDSSRQYLSNIQLDNFKRNKQQQQLVLQSSPFKQKHEQSCDYQQKCRQVQTRRIQRQRERRQFMHRMEHQFRPMIRKDIQNQSQQSQLSQSEVQQRQNNSELDSQDGDFKGQQNQKPTYSDLKNEKLPNEAVQIQAKEYRNFEQQRKEDFYEQGEQHFGQQRKELPFSQGIQGQNPFRESYLQQQQFRHAAKSQDQQKGNNPVDCSVISSTQSSQFRYRLINFQKLTYMLKTTNNPYPHLRSLILIPFKSSNKKHQFLKQLLHFYCNHVQFKIPQPYNSLVLLTVLLFSQIKQEKALIQPLQALYEFVAKQSTTNQFVKTIINLFHSVIEETLPQNRKFLITILLKSMIRMLPFIQDAVSLLRDIQQFYQIGEMVYFQMFQDEYTQIKNYIEEQAVYIIVQKALQQQPENVLSIVEGWLTTSFKTKVIQAIEEFDNQHSEQEQEQQQEQQNHKYQSII